MKKPFALTMITVALLGAAALPAGAAVQDTPAQTILGLAVGPGVNLEVSFADMTNTQGCGFNGSYVIDNTVDAATRQSMLQLLLSAKQQGWKVRVRLNGCADRPKFSYVFTEPLPGQSTTQPTLPSGVISWWPGEGNANDAVGTNQGRLESGVGFAPGKVKQAFSFNGNTDGGGVNLGNVPAFDFAPTSSFTMEAWIKSFGPTVAPNDGQAIFVLNYNCSSTAQVLGIGAGEKVVFVVRDSGGASGSVVSPQPLPKNEWHHVAAVREVTDSGKTLRLYVDGALVGSSQDPSTGKLLLSTDDTIGRRNQCGTLNTFKGLIDEPAIYNRALSGQEIFAIFQAGDAGKTAAFRSN